LGQGRDAVKALLSDNPELADELEAKIKEAVYEKSASGK
jgi:recombination protein RecA